MKGIIIFITIFLLGSNIVASEEIIINESIKTLNEKTKILLSAEMRFIEKTMKEILFLIVSGKYEDIQEKSLNIQNSFVFKKGLSKKQKVELKQKIPKSFFIKDFLFHETAGQLSQAAEMEDSEEVLKEYSKLLTTCVSCHSEFATHRFPNLIE